MIFSKQLKMSPRDLAELISKELIKNKYVEDIDIAGPGFINLFLKKEFWHQQLVNFVSSFDNYNYNVKPKKICIEYVSANPTGRLHIGHARGAVLGDAISSILQEVGHDVDKPIILKTNPNASPLCMFTIIGPGFCAIFRKPHSFS